LLSDHDARQGRKGAAARRDGFARVHGDEFAQDPVAAHQMLAGAVPIGGTGTFGEAAFQCVHGYTLRHWVTPPALSSSSTPCSRSSARIWSARAKSRDALACERSATRASMAAASSMGPPAPPR